MVLEGTSREEAAKIGGMDRQTLRDWVIRFNEQGADGLINISSPGMPPKLNAGHKAFIARIVGGPTPAVHGGCDLIMRLYEQFGLSVSDDTICGSHVCCGSRQSTPRAEPSCADLTAIVPSACDGQLKRLRSSRFANRHSPAHRAITP